MHGMGPRTSASPTEHKGPVQVTQVEEDKVMVLMDGKGAPFSWPPSCLLLTLN